MSTDAGQPGSDKGPPENLIEGQVSFLEQALWKRFAESETPKEFAAPWLALQCRFIDNVSRGVIVLGEGEQGPMVPAAFYPKQ